MTDKPTQAELEYEVELLHGKKIKIAKWSFRARSEAMGLIANKDHYLREGNEAMARVLLLEVVKETLHVDDAGLEELLAGKDEFDEDINFERIVKAIYDNQILPLWKRLEAERKDANPPESPPENEQDDAIG